MSYTVEGFLKGFDKLDNLVLDDCVEFLRGESQGFFGGCERKYMFTRS